MDARLQERTHRAVEAQARLPDDPAPPASAPYDERADWSAAYVTWFIAHTPQTHDLPDDVSPTHRYQVEFNYAVLDPQRYVRETQHELESKQTFH